MHTILAVDTSTTLASVALLRKGALYARESLGVQTHSQVILPIIQELLSEAGITLPECDAIAFGAGPGSFTGVRTACGIAQGLGFGARLPVLPVVTLEAMAESCRSQTQAINVLTILDAAMGEVYWAQYRYTDGWETIIAPTLSAPAAVAPQGDVLACGNGLRTYAAAFSHAAFMREALPDVLPHAAQIGLLGMDAFKKGKAIPAHDAQPFYLRNKVAYTTAERAEQAKGCG